MPTPEQQIKAIERSLTNVTPGADGIEHIEAVREAAKGLGRAIILLTPQSREQSLALTNLEQAAMWAVKGIVLHEDELDG